MNNSLTTTKSAAERYTELLQRHPTVEWHAHLDLQVRSGQMAKDTATTYRQGMRKLTEWASQQERMNIAEKMIEPYYNEDGITIYNADCRDVLPQLEPVDLVLTDPPYGIQANKTKAHSSIRDNPKWATGEWDNKRPEKATFDMLLNAAPLVAIWGGNYFADLLPASSAWLCWRKPEAETGFSLADIELCWTSGDFAARCKTYARRDGNLHPTQKPLAVMKWSMSFFPEAKTILDPFMGSGTTLRAAKDLGLKAIGIEVEEKYCRIAVERLRQQAFSFEATS